MKKENKGMIYGIAGMVVFILILWLVIYFLEKRKENLTQHPSWIVSETPLPKKISLEADEYTTTTQKKYVLTNSVDPGAHVKCENLCKTLGLNEDSYNVCIDACLQDIWTDQGREKTKKDNLH